MRFPPLRMEGISARRGRSLARFIVCPGTNVPVGGCGPGPAAAPRLSAGSVAGDLDARLAIDAPGDQAMRVFGVCPLSGRPRAACARRCRAVRGCRRCARSAAARARTIQSRHSGQRTHTRRAPTRSSARRRWPQACRPRPARASRQPAARASPRRRWLHTQPRHAHPRRPHQPWGTSATRSRAPPARAPAAGARQPASRAARTSVATNRPRPSAACASAKPGSASITRFRCSFTHAVAPRMQSAPAT